MRIRGAEVNDIYTQAAGRPHPFSVNTTALTAFQIAKKYRGKVPSPQQLQADYGMHRATAYRWIAAMRLAEGV